MSLHACISNITSNFREITNWKESNGKVQSLLNVNDTIYVGTKITPVDNVYTGKLIKITKDNTITILSKWNVNNGEIYSLTTSTNESIYIETKTGDGQGYLYKVKWRWYKYSSN